MPHFLHNLYRINSGSYNFLRLINLGHSLLLGIIYTLSFVPHPLLPFIGILSLGALFQHLENLIDPLFIEKSYSDKNTLHFQEGPQAPRSSIAQISDRFKLPFHVTKPLLLHLFLFFGSHFCTSLYWVGYAFDTIHLSYMGPFAVLGLSLILIPFHLPLFLGVLYGNKYPQFKFILFASFFVLTEFLRGNLCTGFPWNFAGHMWGMQSLGVLKASLYTGSADLFSFDILIQDIGLPFMQIAFFVKLYGLSFLTIYGALWGYQGLKESLDFFLILKQYPTIKTILSFNSLIRAFSSLIMVSGIFIIFFIWGDNRLHQNPTCFDQNNPLRLRLVQPSIDPCKKWSPSHFQEVLQLTMDLSLLKRSKKPLDAIIWPEAAVPIPLNEYPEIREQFAKAIPSKGFLITGTIFKEESHQTYYSAMMAIDTFGNIRALHKKVHLLPFGEYIPFKKWLPLEKFTPGTTDYTAGESLNIIHELFPSHPFSPLICYEAIFPGEVVPKQKNQGVFQNNISETACISTPSHPQWMLNITNDAWYKDSIGLWQHFAMVRFRSIEEGLPLVRVANTGISAVVDSVGRILHHTKINEVTFLDIELPCALKRS